MTHERYSLTEEDALYWQLQGPPQIQSYLGAGRIDPFNSIAGFELPRYGHEVLDYGNQTTPVRRTQLTYF